MKIKIGTLGKPITVKNDGGIYIVKVMGPRRRERAKVPITNYEAKRRDAGGVKRSAGQKERFNPKTLAQEVAELLAQAMVNCKGEILEDQDAFILSIHGTQVRLVSAFVSKIYLECLRMSEMPTSQ